MSIIPADLSTMHAMTGGARAAGRRLPRAIGWALAAMVSGSLWMLAFQAIRLAV